MSGSYVGVQMVPKLSIEGKKVTCRRPHTTCGHRAEDEENASESGTYIVDDKTERQTKVKMDSLERRLRANEKARKELEEELEKWKSRALKSEKNLPELNAKLMELTKQKGEAEEARDELEAKFRVHQEEKTQSQEKADSSERRLDEMCCHIASLLIEDQEELEVVRHSPEEVFEKIKGLLGKWKLLKEENNLLLDQIRKGEERLEKATRQLEKVGNEVQQLKKQDFERRDEQLQELHITNEVSEELKQNIQRMESSTTQHLLEMEMLRAELRCCRSRNHELEQSTKNLTVLMRSSESEKKALLETLAALLGKDEADEQEIKRAIRTMLAELESIRTEKMKQEQEAKSREDGLLNQAKQLRSALFRARTAEDETTVITEKLQTAEQEILAIEVELKAAQKRLEELEGVIQVLTELLDVQGESQLNILVKRVAELVNFELSYGGILGENKMSNDLRLLRYGGSDTRQIEEFRRRLKAAEAHGAIKKASDIVGKQLLTKMTLDTMRAADSQKTVLKYKLSEQEKKIRNLEKEKREAEKLKNILSHWEKKEDRMPPRLRDRSKSSVALMKQAQPPDNSR